jgi:hypothetical protein
MRLRSTQIAILLAAVTWPASPQTATGVRYSNTTPPAPSGSANVIWQHDASTPIQNISAYVAAPSNFTVFNVKTTPFNAMGDERFFADAAITSGSYTLTSASAAFTSADTGKVVTVEMGIKIISAGTYTSGITATGTSGTGNCVLTFNNGATATLTLTYTNGIAGGTALFMTSIDAGYTSAPTTATVSNGTATCSGTPVLATTLKALAVQTTGTYVNTTTLTLTSAATSTVSGAKASIGTDDSTAIITAITAAKSAGGGVVYFPHGSYLILSQIALPNNGGAPEAQVPFEFRGDGPFIDGGFGTFASTPTSRLDLRYSGSVAKIQTFGHGILKIDNLSLEDNGYDTTPIFYTTNTTVNISGNSFCGPDPGGSLSAVDAIVLGGTSSSTSGSNAEFNGDGSWIEKNFFYKIAHEVNGQNEANSINIRGNFGADNSGGTEAILLNATGGAAAHNQIYGNNIEVLNYQYGFTYNNVSAMQNWADTFWDAGIQFQAGIQLLGVSPGHTCSACGTGSSSLMSIPLYADNSGNGNVVSETGPGVIAVGVKGGGQEYIWANYNSMYITTSPPTSPYSYVTSVPSTVTGWSFLNTALVGITSNTMSIGNSTNGLHGVYLAGGASVNAALSGGNSIMPYDSATTGAIILNSTYNAGAVGGIRMTMPSGTAIFTKYALMGSNNTCHVTSNVSLSGTAANICSWTLPPEARTWNWQCDGTYTLAGGSSPTLSIGVYPGPTTAPTSIDGTAAIDSTLTGTTTKATVHHITATANTILLTGATNTQADAPFSTFGSIQATATSSNFSITATANGSPSSAAVNVGTGCTLW